ncbi:MAG: clostripain-related cysteine peptidase [Rikenellaceae bacterium]
MRQFLLYLSLILTFVACDKDTEFILEEGQLEQTTLVYFTGTSLKSYFNTNISDAETAVAAGALGRGGRLLYLLPSSYSSATLYELTQVNSACATNVIKTYELNTLTATAVTQVIEDVKNYVNYNDEDMSLNLVVSGHGTGWVLQDHPNLRSIDSSISIWDKEDGALPTRFMGSSTDGFMDIEVLQQSIEDSNTKFGFILFDECLMSNIELLYRLRDCCDYIVASPSEIMAAGFPYEYVLPYLFTDNGYKFDLVGVCEAYNYYYTSVASYNYGCVAMCVTDELEPLVDIIADMSFESVDTSTIQTYENLTDNVFYDLGQFVNLACANDSALTAFNEQFDLAFPESCRLHTKQYYTGLSNSGAQDINYYSGVSTSDPSTKFREDWALEPWTIDTGRVNSIE